MGGYGLCLSLREITPELAKELTETGVTDENFDELELELEDTDEDECGITCGLEIHVDGQKIANAYEGDSGIEDKEAHSFQIGEARQMQLRENDGGEWALANKKSTSPLILRSLIEIFDLCSAR